MIRQIKNYVLYGFVFVMLLLACLFFRQAFLVMLLLLMCLLPVCSIALTSAAFKKLTVTVTSAAYQSEKGLEVPLTISLKNQSAFPLLHVECQFHIHSPFYEEKEDTIYVLPASAHAVTDFSLPVLYAHCGLFQSEILQVKVYDYLHFYSFSRKEDAHTFVTILPENGQTVSYHPALFGEGFDEYEASSIKGNISSNVTDIREYQPGDRLQKIHWKLSAKIDKLMVKENEATSSHQFYVLLELYKDLEHPEWLDDAIEYAYALCKELLAQNETFFFGFYRSQAKEFASFPIRYESDVIEAFGEAFYETGYEIQNLALDVYRRVGLQKGTLLQVTHQGVLDELTE